MTKREVNRAELAEVLNVSLPTVDSWVRKGCPVLQRGGRGREWRFDLAAVHAWNIERKVAEATGAAQASEDELRRRKLAADVELAELELAKARELVVSVEQVRLNLSNLFEIIKTNLRNVPGRVVSSLVGSTDERHIKRTILAEIDLELSALADTELPILETPEETEDEQV